MENQFKSIILLLCIDREILCVSVPVELCMVEQQPSFFADDAITRKNKNLIDERLQTQNAFTLEKCPLQFLLPHSSPK
jgi:hypothetical protein